MAEVLGADGEPIRKPVPPPEPHRFGHFVIPDGVHIKGFGGVVASAYNGGSACWGKRQEVSPRDRRHP